MKRNPEGSLDELSKQTHRGILGETFVRAFELPNPTSLQNNQNFNRNESYRAISEGVLVGARERIVEENFEDFTHYPNKLVKQSLIEFLEELLERFECQK